MGVVSETTANKWQGIILANIKKNETWIPLLNKDWKVKKVANRGFTGAQAAETAVQVDQMLEYLSQYAPNCLYRDITLRATSLCGLDSREKLGGAEVIRMQATGVL